MISRRNTCGVCTAQRFSRSTVPTICPSLSPRLSVSAMRLASTAAPISRAVTKANWIAANGVHGRAPSCITIISDSTAVALTPFQTESCRSTPPATNCHGFCVSMRLAKSTNAGRMSSRVTKMISSASDNRSNRRQVCPSSGRPAMSRNILSPRPIRLPLPAATITMETPGINADQATRSCATCPWTSVSRMSRPSKK